MSFENLVLSHEGEVAIVTVNRPKALNALNRKTLDELREVFESLDQDAGVKVVILTGSGEKAFVAGADIVELQSMDTFAAREAAIVGQGVMDTIEKLSKPVIGAINGFALGGGCELAMACDIRLASDNAKFGLPEVSLGVIPGFAGTQRLPRLIGKGRAKELMFTGDMVDAQEAYRLGLANKVVSQVELLDTALKMAQKISSRGPVAIRLGKEAVNKGMELDQDKANAYEAELFALCFATEDQKEGMLAFVEKRAAQFKGC